MKKEICGREWFEPPEHNCLPCEWFRFVEVIFDDNSIQTGKAGSFNWKPKPKFKKIVGWNYEKRKLPNVRSKS